MSFSRRVKEELIPQYGNSRHCRLAELSAIMMMSAQNVDGCWILDEENEYTIDVVKKLIKLLNIDINSDDGKSALKLRYENGEAMIDKMLVERSCCKRAFLKGVFLASGSVTNPEKGYHMEMVFDTMDQANLVEDIFRDFELETKTILRKNHHVVYFKDGSYIVDALNLMGAHVALMEMENVRILKDMRNSVNRRVNCETANMNKAVCAGVKQQEDIKFINEKKGLKFLPENLREIAELRLEEPELPLKELGEMLDPPLGKSGVNHRLKKISEIAEELRRN